MTEQNYKNHGKIVPAFHYFVVPVLDRKIEGRPTVRDNPIYVRAFSNSHFAVSRCPFQQAIVNAALIASCAVAGGDGSPGRGESLWHVVLRPPSS